MPKFFVKEEQIQENQIIILGQDVNHIKKVLRAKIGDELQICNSQNGENFLCEIDNLEEEKIICQIKEKIQEQVESNIEVTIFQGLPKADKMEYIIQKCTELGAVEFIPVALKRCIVKLNGKDEAKKIERWQKIAEVASKQSGRDMIPNVKNVITINKLKEEIEKFDLFIVAYEEEKEVTLKQILQANKDKILEKEGSKIGVVIGPEGGIDKQEIDELKLCGAKIITLGSRILRTETAPIGITSNIMYEFES